MPKRVPDEATCAICGRHFDPSETRGWCPNPNCGEWQHPSFPVDEGGTEPEAESDAGPVDSSPSMPMQTCPNCGNEVRAKANFCKHCAAQLTGSNEPQSTPETTDVGVIDTCPDCGADLSGIPSERLSSCPICLFDLTPVIDESGVGSESDPNRSELTECPNCGEDLTPIPEDMRTVCPGCRADLEGVEAESGSTGPPSPEGQSAPPPGDSRTGIDDGSPDRDRDTASAPIDSLEFIAAGYAQRLSEVGIRTVGDLVGGDPDSISANTGISARRIRRWVNDAPLDPEDVEGRAQAAGTDRDRDETNETDSAGQPAGTDWSSVDQHETAIQRSPDDLVLEVMGQEIDVTDGATVGREVRKAMVEAGAPEEEAVYVHRKHIRIDVDDGFYLTRLGENSLTVNGRLIEKGNQARIEDGDEIDFSDVVTATVSIR